MRSSYLLLGLVAMTSLRFTSGQCSNGLDGVDNGGDICCEAQCGTCGGSGCRNRPGGTEGCCVGTIRDSGVLCTTSSESPCIMTDPAPTPPPTVCPPGSDMCDDPHMQGLRGQTIDWSGVDGGWYCLVTDDNANVHVNVRLTAPLPEEFPDRQLITGLSVISDDHSLAIEVTNPYSADTNGCGLESSPCLADGGLRTIVDGKQVDGLLRSSRFEYVADGILVSASNLPAECRQFGGDKIWARMYEQMQQGRRRLAAEDRFEEWVLCFDSMATPDWCAQYIATHDLAEMQSNHAIFQVVTPDLTVRLNVGTNFQGNGELNWDGRVLPDLEFWQMDVELHGLFIESNTLSGILGETARPVVGKDGLPVMTGDEAFRGTVEDCRVSGSLGTDFAFQNNN